jgi:hypothetical protein
MHHVGACVAVPQQLLVAWRAGYTRRTHSTDSTETIMLDPKFLEDMSARISAALAATPAADIEKNLRALLTAQLAKFDLVTRADFEIQKELLARAQSRLAQLEARLAELETQRKA